MTETQDFVERVMVDNGLVVRCAAEIEPEPIEFLWPGRLAKGKHTAIAGDPGDGKSQLLIFIAAMISTGGAWPCEEGKAPVGNVVILSAEDGAADTIVPRLIAAGADLTRVHIVSAVLDKAEHRRAFNLQADLKLLEQKIAEIGNVALVGIDPISSYMGGTDSHKNAEVRGVLEPVSEMAERMRVAILSVTHFNKAGSGGVKALHRFIGSIAFTGAPRAAFAVVRDAEDEDRLLFLPAKNNMAPSPQGLAYRLVQTILPDHDIVTSHIAWDTDPVDVSANDAMAESTATRDATTADEATDLLRTILGDGEHLIEDVEAEARSAGLLGREQEISQSKPFRTARKKLGVKHRREGFGKGATFFWFLPYMPSNTIHAPLNNRASMGNEGMYGGPVCPRCDGEGCKYCVDLAIPEFLKRAQ